MTNKWMFGSFTAPLECKLSQSSETHFIFLFTNKKKKKKQGWYAEVGVKQDYLQPNPGLSMTMKKARGHRQSHSNSGNPDFHIPYHPRTTPKEIKISTKLNFGAETPLHCRTTISA
jgi:hypothetical protein